MSNEYVAPQTSSVSCPSLLEETILPREKNNGFNDDDPGTRVHCKNRLLESLDQIFVWPGMTDVSHHIDFCTYGLWAKEIMGLERDFCLEFSW